MVSLLSVFNPSKHEQIKYIYKAENESLIWVDPSKISLVLKESFRKTIVKDQQFIVEGDWDQKQVSNIEDEKKMIHDTVYAMFVEGKDYTITPQYQYMVERVRQKLKAYWCKSLEDVNEYFHNLNNAFENIKKEGYKTQRQINNKNLNDEIRLYIDSKGSLINSGGGGNHRLIISKILNLKMIPVIVKGIHYDYLEEKSRIYKTNNLLKVIELIFRDINLKK